MVVCVWAGSEMARTGTGSSWEKQHGGGDTQSPSRHRVKIDAYLESISIHRPLNPPLRTHWMKTDKFSGSCKAVLSVFPSHIPPGSLQTTLNNPHSTKWDAFMVSKDRTGRDVLSWQNNSKIRVEVRPTKYHQVKWDKLVTFNPSSQIFHKDQLRGKCQARKGENPIPSFDFRLNIQSPLYATIALLF